MVIWGMYLPSSGGPYGPYGDFEGAVDVYGDGWNHRLIRYGDEILSEHQKAFYGGSRKYSYCVGEKFLYEVGHKQPGPDDVVVTPIEHHEPPRFFQMGKSFKELSSIVSLPNRIWAVDETVKSIIEKIEPGIHNFYPLEMRMPRGKIYPVHYYILVVGPYLQIFLPGESSKESFRSYEGNGVKWYGLNGYKAEIEGHAFRKSVYKDAHLWRERGLNEWLICLSDMLRSALDDANLKLPKHYRMREL